ncbi:MAG: hypothetical protein K2J13_04925 [Clostridia bacterium]|nr:hypothetical protein [Clostridia bacterium]
MIKRSGDGSVKIEFPKDLLKKKICINYINRSKSASISIDSDCKEPVSLSFLKDIKYTEIVKRLRLCGNIDITDAVYRFTEITDLDYFVKNKNTSIDISKFPKAKILCTTSPNQIKNLDESNVAAYAQYDDGKVSPEVFQKLNGLVDLRLHGPKDFSFKYIANPEKLKIVFFTQCNIKNLSGIDRISNLHLLCLCYCRSISSIEGVSKLTKLKKVLIESCPRLTDISELGKMENLKVLILQNIKNCDLSFLEDMACAQSLECLVLRNCGSIPSIKFLDKYPKLKCFDFLYTNVVDGDLTPCLRLESVTTFNKRHYNLKYEQLPDGDGFMKWGAEENDTDH